MADRHDANEGVEASVARPGGVSYLQIPARDLAESAAFYRAVFGWEVRGDARSPSFSDGTGHVIGHWRTDLHPVGEAGVLPYVYVDDLDEALRRAIDHGAEIVTPTYPEGTLRIATIRDPAGNVIGIWHNPPA
jgi:predicted enzyme related to lactoylglutathione lyase